MNISPVSMNRNQYGPNFGMALKITPAAVARIKENLANVNSKASDKFIKELTDLAVSSKGDKVDVLLDVYPEGKGLMANIIDKGNNFGYEFCQKYTQPNNNLFETKFVQDAVIDAKRIQHLNESMASLSKFSAEG